jgi:hypothetical protein
MRNLLLALLTTSLLSTIAGAYPTHGNPGGHFGLPDFSAVVRGDCTNAAENPCFETIQAAVSYVQAQDATTGTGFRLVRVYPKPDASNYDEDVECCGSDGAGGSGDCAWRQW